jgi:TolA-binding protein
MALPQGPQQLKEWYNNADEFLERYQHIITTIVVGVVVIVGGYFGYQRFYVQPREQEAQEQMFMAQQYFSQDSLQLAIRGDGNYPGFSTIVDQYSGTQAANLAQYYLGMSYLHMGDYRRATTHLQKFEANDIFLSTLSKGALGDAYSELGQQDKAAEHYKKAAKHNTNELTTPVFLFKAALAYEKLGQFKKAHSLFKQIQKEYPKSEEAKKIDKYIARVEAQL